MKIGATFPTTEIGNDPAVIRDWIQTAERLGYDYVLTYDHVLGAEHARRDPALVGPHTEEHPFHEPFVLFAFMAGITRRIERATSPSAPTPGARTSSSGGSGAGPTCLCAR